MKTDSIFYRLFQLSPRILFDLIGESSQTAGEYEFRSVELKQTAFRIDGAYAANRGGLAKREKDRDNGPVPQFR